MERLPSGGHLPESTLARLSPHTPAGGLEQLKVAELMNMACGKRGCQFVVNTGGCLFLSSFNTLLVRTPGGDTARALAQLPGWGDSWSATCRTWPACRLRQPAAFLSP